MKWISLGCMLCLLQLADAVCECGDGHQSLIPALLNIDPPNTFNGTGGSPSSFGSTCEEQSSLYVCTDNTDNPLFDCSASNNSYYGWNSLIQSRNFTSIITNFSIHFQSMNILMTFLISTSSNVSAPSSIWYAPFVDQGEIFTFVESTSIYSPPTNLPEGPYQHNCTLSRNTTFNGVLISIIPNPTFQWVAINRIIFCAAATEVSSVVSPTVSSDVSPTVSDKVLTTVSTILPTASATGAVTSNVPSSDNDDDSVSIAVISGAVVGTLLLIIIIVIVTVIVVIILCNRRRKRSRRTHNIDHKVKQHLNAPNPQQHTHDTSDQSQHDHTDSGILQLGAKVEPKSKLETVNALYISSKVKSLDSLLRRHDTSRSDVIGCDVIITPNPSYAVGPNSSETAKECEDQYDYVQTDDGSVQHDKVVGATTSGGEYDEVIDPADNVIIDPNPSYLLPQHIKLEDNPSYTQLLAS